MFRPRIASAMLLALAMLAGCSVATPAAAPSLSQAPTATAAPPPSPTPTPPPPSPTPEPVFAAGSEVGGVDVGGLTADEAAAAVREALADGPAPLKLRAGPAQLTVEPAAIGLSIPVDDLLARAAPSLGAGAPADVPLEVQLDEAALRERLAALAAEVGVEPAFSVISSTDVLSRSFAYSPGRSLDLDAAVELVRERVREGRLSQTISLPLAEGEEPPQVPLDRLLAEVEDLAAELKGVVGLHLHDLESGEAIGFQDRSVFAGASTIKTAIMLNAFINLDKLSERQEFWLNEMIRYSDNLSANNLLAAAAGGTSTDSAFVGADEMSTMLQEELGLEHTYLYVPYETTDFIKLYKPKFRCGPRAPVGAKPYTEHGTCLRATPYAMAQLYLLIDQCASGEGALLEKFERLSPKRCQEMLDWLARNNDKTRMVAGIPAGVRVEHKSGWIEFMQADAGIVRSPGGDYILSVYYYRPLTGGRTFWDDKEMAPVVAAFSRLAYTAYNPVKAEE